MHARKHWASAKVSGIGVLFVSAYEVVFFSAAKRIEVDVLYTLNEMLACMYVNLYMHINKSM